jgi:transposase
VRRAGVEGTGSYGAALTRFLPAEGVAVIEVNRPDRAKRRRRGKSDTVDAAAAAEAVISGRATATPKGSDGPVEQIRVYKIAKDSAVKACANHSLVWARWRWSPDAQSSTSRRRRPSR